MAKRSRLKLPKGKEEKLQAEASSSALFFRLSTIGSAIVIGAIWAAILSRCHEQRTWWSAANLERKEVTFMTEEALYYSYFKATADQARPLREVLAGFVHDDTVEYPNVINAFKRFNIWPEVALGVLYRLIPLGQPIDFYVNAVFAINSFLAGGAFYCGALLTSHWLGGVVAFVSLCANFQHSTRAWVSVALRESQAIPWIYAQMAVLTFLLMSEDATGECQKISHRKLHRTLTLFTLLALLSWQLSPSVLALQVASLFACHLCGSLSAAYLRKLLACHLRALAVALLLSFGNAMLLTSPYLCVTVACTVATFNPWRADRPMSFGRIMTTGMAALVIGGLVKALLVSMVGGGDDKHMYQLLQAKYGNFRDFHTSLYLHMDSFRTISPEIALSYVKTTTLLWASLAVAITGGRTVLGLVKGISLVPPAEQFHLFTALSLCGTAVMFSRLRFLWTPHLGISCALLFSSYQPLSAGKTTASHGQLLLSRPVVRKTIGLSVICLSMYVASGGFAYLHNRLTVEELFDLPELRELTSWLKANTPPSAVIAGDMSTMASVRLMADRRVANHPHYEDLAIRKKTYQIAHWFGRRKVSDVAAILSDMNITHIVNHRPPCEQRLGALKATYADFLELGEGGSPPPPLAKTSLQCCLAVKDPDVRRNYFELVRNTVDWPVYRVIKQPSAAARAIGRTNEGGHGTG